jgi:hypothetical protein
LGEIGWRGRAPCSGGVPALEDRDDMWGRGVRGREGVLTRGVLLSAGERGRGDTLSGLAPGGPWASFGAGLEVFPAALFMFFLLFFLFFFCFLISSINSSNLVQIDSNQFLKFSKIQGNKSRQ